MANDKSADEILETDIFQILGDSPISEDEKAELIKKMLETIRFRVLDRVLDLLSDQDVKTWEDLLDTKDDAKINGFLSAKGIDMQTMMLEETMKYKIEVAAVVDYMKTSGKSLEQIQGVIDQIGSQARSTEQ